MDVALRAIADPRRRKILQLLGNGELTAGQIAGHFTITRPAISQHLAALKEAELVHERRQGTRRFYSMRLEGLAELRAYLDSFWGTRLDRLRDVVASDRAATPMQPTRRMSE
jgi:DNA-binding transcriptional ArsR family regulator